MKTVHLGVLVSGGGSNLEAILKAQKDGQLENAQVSVVISNRPGVKALDRARSYNVPTVVIDHRSFQNDLAFQNALVAALQTHQVSVICLAGFLRKLGAPVLQAYSGRILNIHPALLPKYGGPGMYGHFVHEAVLQAQETESGCTVHLVDEVYDSGPILSQARVPVQPNDTPDTLAARVLEQEHRLYPKAIAQFCKQLSEETSRS